MKITSIKTYTPNRTPIGFKSAPIKAVRTVEPELNHYIDVLSHKYAVSAHIQFFLDGLSKIKTNNTPLKIADIGCCDGALSRIIRQYMNSETEFFGVDLSAEMLDRAKLEDEKFGFKTKYQVANAFDLPYKENSMDALILSSIMHELYSYASPEYGEKEYSKESILHFMQSAFSILASGGVLIIKDPATSDKNIDEEIKFINANKENGVLPFISDETELRAADITKVCSYNKLQRFCMEFAPAQGQIKWDKDGNCIMPRWLVTEFLRQRKCIRTPEYWAYEIKERYGTMRPEEMVDFAKKVGFDVIKAENLYISNKVNEYAIDKNEFVMKDSQNNTLTFEDFPMFLQVVLRKPFDS